MPQEINTTLYMCPHGIHRLAYCVHAGNLNTPMLTTSYLLCLGTRESPLADCPKAHARSMGYMEEAPC